MAVIIDPNSGAAAAVGAAAASGLHTIGKPHDYGSLGHYQVAVQTGAIAAGMAANGELFQIRWTDATRLCLIQKISILGMRATTAFAAGTIDIKATVARAFSASGTGGTALTLTGNNQAMRTSMGTSLVGDMRVATTAALGAGTKTLGAQDLGQILTHTGATPAVGQIPLPLVDIFECDGADGEHVGVLAQNEGVVIRATVPATGVWNLGILVKWAEVAAF